MIYNIGITSGDTDGIGLEVSAKSLVKLGPNNQFRYFLWTEPSPDKKYLRLLKKRFQVVTAGSVQEALSLGAHGPEVLFNIIEPGGPPNWVQNSALACKKNLLAALVTAPMSKQACRDAGFSDIGHTDILKRIDKKKHAFMGFVGREFNVVLATGHIPISKVSSALDRQTLARAYGAARQLVALLPKRQGVLPIGILGLNPHAGDDSIIGLEDMNLIKKFITKSSGSNVGTCIGPLVPDVAFQRVNWKKFSCYLACYHDQGLIPFKLIHGYRSGVHLTLGLSLKRTSVDHGTAKDIFGKDLADPSSMTEAIMWAQTWSKTQSDRL